MQHFYFKNLHFLLTVLLQGTRVSMQQFLSMFSDMKFRRTVFHYLLFVTALLYGVRF
jgi:hypothetical protein